MLATWDCDKPVRLDTPSQRNQRPSFVCSEPVLLTGFLIEPAARPSVA